MTQRQDIDLIEEHYIATSLQHAPGTNSNFSTTTIETYTSKISTWATWYGAASSPPPASTSYLPHGKGHSLSAVWWSQGPIDSTGKTAWTCETHGILNTFDASTHRRLTSYVPNPFQMNKRSCPYTYNLLTSPPSRSVSSGVAPRSCRLAKNQPALFHLTPTD
jgi:hypothetical protein